MDLDLFNEWMNEIDYEDAECVFFFLKFVVFEKEKKNPSWLLYNQ